MTEKGNLNCSARYVVNFFNWTHTAALPRRLNIIVPIVIMHYLNGKIVKMLPYINVAMITVLIAFKPVISLIFLKRLFKKLCCPSLNFAINIENIISL